MTEGTHTLSEKSCGERTEKSCEERTEKPAGKDKLPRKGKRGIFAKKRTKKPVGKDKLPTQREKGKNVRGNSAKGSFVAIPSRSVLLRGKNYLNGEKEWKSVGRREEKDGTPTQGKTRKGEFCCRKVP